MKNRLVTTTDGEKLWHSRSVAVVSLVFKEINNITHILCNKRGKGTPDFQGCWNVPCGYLDWNETGNEAAAREIKEETDYDIDPQLFTLCKVITDPTNDKRQNVTLRYIITKLDSYNIKVKDHNIENLKGGEKDEVEAIKWISIKDLDKYKWAFNHDKMIKEMYSII